jgi:deazaflavin-dependent oxidoreductase (nitroreductase family)
VGTKSGKVRNNPVMRIVDGDRYVAVAPAGGSPTNPSWYANLVAHPRVRLQDGASVREFAAREVTGDEKRYYWAVAERFGRTFPNIDGWQAAATSRSWCWSRSRRARQSPRLSGTAAPLSPTKEARP